MMNSIIIVNKFTLVINNAQNVMHIADLFTVMMANMSLINIEIKTNSISHSLKEKLDKQY